mgnify:CR=1 FL=1
MDVIGRVESGTETENGSGDEVESARVGGLEKGTAVKRRTKPRTSLPNATPATNNHQTNQGGHLVKISSTWAPLVVSAVRDAILYQENLLKSETIRNKADYQEHIVQLSELLEYLKEEYKPIEDEAGIPLDKLL